MKYFLSLLILFSSLLVSAQTNYLFLVSFKDKSTTEYSLSNPTSFLSQKAIERRTKIGIGIDSLDLPVSSACIDSVLNRGFSLKCKVKWFNSIVISTLDSSSVSQLLTMNLVKSVQFVGYITSQKNNSEKKSKESVSNNKSSLMDYGDAYTQINMLGGDLMHDLGYKGEGVLIAVLDAGFLNANNVEQLSHLFENNRVKGTWNFVDNTSNVYQVYSGSHGTNVLSIISGYSPGNIIGAAPNADFLLLRTENGDSEYIVEEYNWAAGAAYADSAGADVINSSLGYTTFQDTSMDHSYSDMNGKVAPSSIAATIAARKGIIVCNSAGNDGSKSWRYIGAPADADSILTVGAVDSERNYASFSSIGKSFDGRVKPDVTAMGKLTTTVTPYGDVIKGNGTSFSSPLIAGLSACLVQSHPTLTNFQIMDAIKKSASQFSAPDEKYGYGIPNFNFANLLLNNIIIEKQNSTNLVNVFPNPFDDKLNVLYFSADTQMIIIELVDSKGVMVYSETKNIKQNSYNYWSLTSLNNCQSGVYFLKIIEENERVVTTKLVKGF